MTITMRPMSECHPMHGQRAILYVRGEGYTVGIYNDAVAYNRAYLLASKAWWTIPEYQCGCDTIPWDDERLFGWHPLPDEELTGPV